MNDRCSYENSRSSMTEQMHMMLGGFFLRNSLWCACVHKTTARNNRAHESCEFSMLNYSIKATLTNKRNECYDTILYSLSLRNKRVTSCVLCNVYYTT